MNEMIESIDLLINAIKEYKIYQDYIKISKKVESNEKIILLTNKIRDIQKFIIHIENGLKKGDLTSLNKELKKAKNELDSIPLYNQYKDKVDILENELLIIKNTIENYINNKTNID